MSAALLVVEPGLMTTVQDLGRVGQLARGVPTAGAMDPLALRLGNRVVGNPEDAAGLEFGFLGPVLEAADGPVRLAVAAGGCRPRLARGEAETPVDPWRSLRLDPGDRLIVGPLSGVGNGLVVVAGGVAVPPMMGSRSTYARAGIGGLEGRVLAAGDRLPVGAAAEDGPEHALGGSADALYGDGPIRVVLGPQDDHFTEAAVAAFLSAPYRITKEADRMGFRLDGPALEHHEDKGYNIVSDGIATGAVQVPGNGLPIILLADHQSAGGYPKIACVASCDLPRLGRMTPGTTLTFEAVAVDDAEALRRGQEAAFRRLVASIRPIRDVAHIDPQVLARENLISGVVHDAG